MTAVVVAVAALALLALAWLRLRYLVVTVEGDSMLPTYQPGERVLVRRARPTRVRTGQVVVLARMADEGETRWIIKRLAAVPGDPIPREQIPALRDAPGTQVPAGRLVVVGDNPAQSFDSRVSGYLRADRLLGVVLRKLAPR
ncbi:S26 family signal peptidase [Nonomuraea sp. NPDC001636]|uniref:S26 family signal peptidase n=1 Tax=Nonomuraea sp. NPDC001636 TaxID=3154391 RepID=UPI00331F20AA